jgi:RNA polymerase sigma factor (sigma-70 family)
VRLFEGRLRLMIGARIHDREAARDLAQEALIAALSALREGTLRESVKLAAFVHGVGRNIANNYLRRRQASPTEVPIDPDAMISRDAAVDDDTRERRAMAARALRALPAGDRQVLGLTLVDGLKPGEIAERLGEHVDVIRTRKSRALKKVIAEVARLSRFTLARHSVKDQGQ